MKFGVCGDLILTSEAAKAGYDYAEWSVPNLLFPQDPEDVFLARWAVIRKSTLPYEVANGFVPRSLKITGPDADMALLKAYVKTTMERAERIGLDVIVFGSGAARQVPEGFDHKDAYEQIVAFCQMVGPSAQAHGITVAVEPLNKKDCNILNTVAECGTLVNAVNHPSIRLLADAYHMMLDDDPAQSIVDYGHLLAHVHIATVPNRLPPAAEDCDLTDFFEALKRVEYDGRISIEGQFPQPETQLPDAIAQMRSLS